MIVETKFNIGDLLKHKYSRDTTGHISAVEVLDVKTHTCMAGTQVNYSCRAIQGRLKKSFLDDTSVGEWEVFFGVAPDDGIMSLREDELAVLPDNLKEVIQNLPPQVSTV
jgi:hypothetical protein